ncbi:S9 family peptidase [Corallincola holothuriorum]|uniref:S9 family peptidase n=1 Tax=Corallincola holothuriorum TaxID=2282215 RepID=A0A368N511_9GAMM|nr:S9 family peptidase [Corallincola holothuriorum]
MYNFSHFSRRTCLTLFAFSLSLPLQAEMLSVDRIFSDPSLSGTPPKKLQLAPDGSQVSFIRPREDDYNAYDLWSYHLETGKTAKLVDAAELTGGAETLSDEEKARRERQRIFGSGILEYQWSPDSKTLLFPLAGDLYLYQLTEQKSLQLVKTDAFETDAKVSPNGNYVSFVRDQDLYLVNPVTAEETRVTTDGGGTIKNGMAEFVAQEEMGRMTGYWWSPDETKLAFIRVDNSSVDRIVRSEIYAEEIKQIEQAYPAAGRPNVSYKLGIYQLSDKTTQWIDLGTEVDFYLPRVRWSSTSEQLSYQWQNRSQQLLKLMLVDTKTGNQREVLRETSNTWINLHNDLRFLKDGQHFIWASERDGYKHLYLYTMEGKLLRQLTQGDWIVDKLEAIDETKGLVFFTGRKDSPLEKHLYYVALSGEPRIKRITRSRSYHDVAFAKDASHYLDTSSTVNMPPQVSLHQTLGKQVAWIDENRLNSRHPLTPYQDQWSRPEFGVLDAEDGQEMQYRLFKPVNFDLSRKYPVIVRVYGGPHAQRVVNKWSWQNLWTQVMVQRGFLVFELDNRGSYNRGKAFEDPIYRHLGKVELKDQIRGAQYLKSLPYVDGDQIGIFGHSYGGYMTLISMFEASDIFAAGVSGAPVTDWRLYDTHYTERYLGHPAGNGKGYDASAVFPYAPQLKGPLLIYHGMADDNVLFTHSTKLYSQLQQAMLPFEMMNYPGKKHSIRGKETRIHLYRTIQQFFERHLMPEL